MRVETVSGCVRIPRCRYLTDGGVADGRRPSVNLDPVGSCRDGVVPANPAACRQWVSTKAYPERDRWERQMSRPAERYAEKTRSRTPGVGRQSWPAEEVVHAGERQSGGPARRHLDATGTGGRTPLAAERHDWLVPMELP
jgi:hypothetical protein